LEAGKPLRTLPYGEGGCVSVAVRPGGKQVALGGGDGGRGYDLEAWGKVHTLSHAGTIHGLADSPAGDLVVSASEGRTVRGWDTGTGAEVRAFDLPDRSVGAAFGPDGKKLAVGGDQLLRVWEVGTWKELLARDDVSAAWVGFGPDPNVLWAGPWAVSDG